MEFKPPHRALKFLRWFCREDYLDEIEGDLYELFEYRATNSPKKAKRQFTWDVLRSFRLRNIKKFNKVQNSNYLAMLRHTILLTFRNYKRYKSSFLINLIGLSTGLACAMLIFLWVNDELTIDRFHENGDQLYQVMEQQHNAYDIEVTGSTPGLLAESMVEKFPEIEYAASSTWLHESNLSIDEKAFNAEGYYVSKDYLNVFSFNLLRGSKDKVLKDQSSIVISEALAIKFFNSINNAIGEVIKVDQEHEYKVTGIFEDNPQQSSLQFEFLLPFEAFKNNNPWASSWTVNAFQAYLVLNETTNIEDFNSKIKDFVQENEGEQHISLFITPFAEDYLYGKYENGVRTGGRISYVKLFSIIAIFIIVIACINFMNLSTAKASRRIKEIGVKKVVGANRLTLAFQHIIESMMLTVFSLVVALIMVMIFLPTFNEITGKHLHILLNSDLVFILLMITLFTGLVSGSYPAIFLSGLNPLTTIKGKLNNSIMEILARKGLVVFQFTLSVVLIACVLVVYKQIEYTQTKNLGFNKDNLLRFHVPTVSADKMETMLAEIKKIPGVLNTSSIGHSMVQDGTGRSTSSVTWEGKDPDDVVEMETVFVNYGMIELLGIELKSGRLFDRKMDQPFGDSNNKVIFNETALEIMDLSDPIGTKVELWGSEIEIIGEVKNFHFRSFHEEVNPLLFILVPDQTPIITAKVQAGSEKEVIAGLNTFFLKNFPGFIFDYSFFDEDYQAQYVAEQTVASLSRYFAGIAILISCLGLFGLAAFTAERRAKEIGIRKVMGSSVISILYLLTTDFTRMVGLAIVVAIPISYFLASRWLDDFAYQINLQWWFFALAGIFALIIAWIIVGWQSWKVARLNPITSLKDE